MLHIVTLPLILSVLALPAAAQEQKKVETRVIVNGKPVTAVMVDDDGRAEVVPLGEGQGIAWIGRDPERGGHAVRYFDLGPNRRYIGVQLMQLTPELREHFGIDADAGVMVSKVFEDTPAERAGIEVGDIIVAADGETVASVGDLTRAIVEREADEISIDLVRDGREQTLDVGVEQRRRMLRGMPQGPIGGEMFERLQEYFESDEWKERLERLESTDWGDVEERMKEVERRLRQLEEQLDEK